MLAGFQLTPTATADEQRQPVARMADGSIRHRAAGSPVIARLLQSDTTGHADGQRREAGAGMDALPSGGYRSTPEAVTSMWLALRRTGPV